MTIKGQGVQELLYHFVFVVHQRKFEAIGSGDGEWVEGEHEGQWHQWALTCLFTANHDRGLNTRY